jgi:hypothetical protein
VITRLTLRTRELPEYFGGVFATIKARSDAAFRKLIARVISFYQEQLFNPHWGEQIRFSPNNTITISMVFQGLDRQRAASVWHPFFDWVKGLPQEFSVEREVAILDVPARHFWDANAIGKNAPGVIISDDRPGAPEGNFFWAGNQEEAGQVLHGYESAWLPALLLKKDEQRRLVNALFASSRHWSVSLHFNKGLAGAPAEALVAVKDTAMNPAVLDAFALAIIAGEGPPAFPGIAGHQPDISAARRHARQIGRAMDELLKVVPNPGSYVSESDFFERSWQRSFWGSNYPKLSVVKRKYDPTGLFFVHHGVGSEEWSADGFRRLG